MGNEGYWGECWCSVSRRDKGADVSGKLWMSNTAEMLTQ
jgi:hypothetical protein